MKHQKQITTQHGITSQKTVFFMPLVTTTQNCQNYMLGGTNTEWPCYWRHFTSFSNALSALFSKSALKY